MPVQEAPRRMRDTDTRAITKRVLSTGEGVAREGTPQSVSFDTLFQTGKKANYRLKMNFFEQSEYAMNSEESFPGDVVHYCSQVEQKMAWMLETRIGLSCGLNSRRA